LLEESRGLKFRSASEKHKTNLLLLTDIIFLIDGFCIIVHFLNLSEYFNLKMEGTLRLTFVTS